MKYPIAIAADSATIGYRRHYCELTKTHLFYFPGSYSKVTRLEVQKALKNAVGVMRLSEHDGFFLSRPTRTTFRISCCVFDAAATRVIRKWAAGVK